VASTNFSQQDFEIINTIYIMRMGLNIHNISFEKVVNNIKNSEILDPDRKIFAVLGKSHTQCISNTIEGSI
jgi:hypothetical protein